MTQIQSEGFPTPTPSRGRVIASSNGFLWWVVFFFARK